MLRNSPWQHELACVKGCMHLHQSRRDWVCSSCYWSHQRLSESRKQVWIGRWQRNRQRKQLANGAHQLPQIKTTSLNDYEHLCVPLMAVSVFGSPSEILKKELKMSLSLSTHQTNPEELFCALNSLLLFEEKNFTSDIKRPMFKTKLEVRKQSASQKYILNYTKSQVLMTLNKNNTL